MKKVLASLLVLFFLMASAPFTAEAHNGCARHRKAKKSNVSNNYRNRAVKRYRNRTVENYYATQGYTYETRPSFYRRHRNLINIGIATGAGALIGGIAKGKKGAGIGALIGAGSGALYTYGINPKKRRYYRRY